jgi:hypothetical protein
MNLLNSYDGSMGLLQAIHVELIPNDCNFDIANYRELLKATLARCYWQGQDAHAQIQR